MTREEYIIKYLKMVKSNTRGLEGSDIVVTKDSECYITSIGLLSKSKLIDFLAKHEITQLNSTFIRDNGNPVANIGYSEKENKWYGWSHRAIFGFTIGSSCKMGDCAFVASNKEEFKEQQLNFWGIDEYHINARIENESNDSFDVLAEYTDNVPNELLRGTTYTQHCEYPKKWGRGAWVCKNIDDAKTMAIDFANSVS